MLIANGSVELVVNGDVVGVVSSGSLLGEVGFFDENSAIAGTSDTDLYICDAIAVEDVKYIAFSHEQMAQCFEKGGQKMRDAGAKLEMATLVEKMLMKDRLQPVNSYISMMKVVTANGQLSSHEKRSLREFRASHHISDDVHARALKEVGWSAEEFHDGAHHQGATMKGWSSLFKPGEHPAPPGEAKRPGWLAQRVGLA
jgi:hypothetical protein